jgi:hypothetical protein
MDGLIEERAECEQQPQGVNIGYTQKKIKLGGVVQSRETEKRKIRRFGLCD